MAQVQSRHPEVGVLTAAGPRAQLTEEVARTVAVYKKRE